MLAFNRYKRKEYNHITLERAGELTKVALTTITRNFRESGLYRSSEWYVVSSAHLPLSQWRSWDNLRKTYPDRVIPFDVVDLTDGRLVERCENIKKLAVVLGVSPTRLKSALRQERGHTLRYRHYGIHCAWDDAPRTWDKVTELAYLTPTIVI